MYRTAVVPAAVALAASLAVSALPAHAQPGPGARVWVDGERDLFRRGDRLNVRFTTSQDAYVAVIHVDTDGTLDFIYPANPWDEGYVRGGHVYSASQGRYSSWSVRSRPGIGYLYIISSYEPLDYSYFGAYGRGWDWSFAGRHVRGDPYLALEQITRILVPGWGYGGYSVDYYSYHVDRRHHYPVYACGSSRWGYERGWGWTSHYGPCDRLVVFLRRYPHYYDTHRYRGSRRVYLRGDPLPEVRHGFKAPARSSGSPAVGRPSSRGSEDRATPSSWTAPVERPARQRPTLERRGETPARPSTQTPRARGTTVETVRPAAPSTRSTGGGSARPAQRPTPRSSGGAQPAVRSGGSSGGSSRPAARPTSRGSGGGSQPAARSQGSSGGGSTRPAARPTRGGGSGGGSTESPRARGSRGGGGGR